MSLSDNCSFTAPSDYSVGYHVAAVFVILAASVLGTAIPIVSRHYAGNSTQTPFVYVCGKHIGEKIATAALAATAVLAFKTVDT